MRLAEFERAVRTLPFSIAGKRGAESESGSSAALRDRTPKNSRRRK